MRVEKLTNRDYIVGKLVTAFRLPVWLAGALFAGFVGAQFANARSNLQFSRDLSTWSLVVVVLLVLSAYVWWRSLLQLAGRGINDWLTDSRSLDDGDRRAFEEASIGYTITDNVRSKLHVRGTEWLSLLTFSGAVLAWVDLVRISGH